ncbi:MAG: hypothetical protein GQ570_03205 [Helicobacteraceae bacterium]|nr:hypothetical protein [Helicobacteraceae bacterium]
MKLFLVFLFTFTTLVAFEVEEPSAFDVLIAKMGIKALQSDLDGIKSSDELQTLQIQTMQKRIDEIYTIVKSLKDKPTLTVNDGYRGPQGYKVAFKAIPINEDPEKYATLMYMAPKGEILYLTTCDIHGWCKLTTGGYAQKFLLRAVN